jgi:resuscitation-promoting factor RpfB
VRRAAYRALLLAVLVASGFTWVALDKTVTVEVDGTPRSVRTYARSVAGVLDEAGVDVGAHDLVAPGPDAGISDGARVVVRRGRQVQVTVNGRLRTVWVTALSVDEALAQLGVRQAANAFVSASRSRRIPLDGLAFEVRTPATVRVLADGKEREVVTTAATVGDVLAQARLTLAKTDTVTPALDTYPADGTAVRVTRVRGASARETFAIPFRTERRSDASLFKGSTRTLVAGQSGLREKVYELTVVDGKVRSRRLVRDRVVRQPRTKVVLVGTKPRPVYMGTDTSRVDHLNWRALARCESGGNPRAVGGGGRYFGLYQFMLSTWRSVGGRGNPIDASSAEQTYRAKLLYMRRGSSPWGYCGSRLFS